MKPFRHVFAAAALSLAMSATSAAAADVFSFAPAHIPNFFGIGIGAAPDYVGSDDDMVGGLPVGRLRFSGERYLSLEGNAASFNLLQHPNWRAGPMGLYRFGRDDDVDDPVVKRMKEIDDTIELGGFLSYELVAASDPRNRWLFGGNVLFDVGDSHDGMVATAQVRRWLPVGRSGAFGLGAAVTYGSEDYTQTYFSVTPQDAAATGLPVFDAGDGLRDIRVIAAYMQPLNRHWILGAGAMYSRLLGDAADSPVVEMRGDRDQLIYGFGVAYTW